MQDTVFRSLENPRVLDLPLETAEAGTCPHKQNEETQGTQLVPHIVVKRNALGHIENNADKRRELWDNFEKDLGLEDELNPMDEPTNANIRVLKVNGTVSRVL